MKRIIGIIVVLSVGLGIALYFQLGRQEASKLAAAGGTGIIEGVEVDVVARLPARILTIKAEEGQTVEAGQVLVELDCSEYQAALNQAKATQMTAEAAVLGAEAGATAAVLNTRAAYKAADAAHAQIESARVGVDTASREAKRVASMSQAGAISASRLDRAQSQLQNLSIQVVGLQANQAAVQERASAARGQTKVAQARILSAKAQVEVAKAAVMRAEALVSECVLVAPRQGQVLTRNFEPGEAVLPGAKLLTLVDLAEARATFFLPNAELAAAATGKQVTVRADAWPELTFKGSIRHVSAKAEFTPRNVQTREDRDRLVYGVEIAVPNPEGKLRPGMPVEVSIDGTEKTN